VSRQFYNDLLHIIDPGALTHDALGGEVVGWAFLIIMLTVTVAGLFVFGSFIGIISTGLQERLTELRKGHSVVLERDHTLILGWSPNVITIITEILIARSTEKRPPIVVFANRDKNEMEDEIRSKVDEIRRARLVVRTGDPTDPDELAISNPQGARSIIVLGESGDDPDSEVLKTILAIVQSPERKRGSYHIVGVLRDSDNLEAAVLVGKNEAVFIDERDMIARVIVQAARQSGTSLVYTELISFDGDEIYFKDADDLVGGPFSNALFAYEDFAAIGLYRGGKALVNPRSKSIIEEGDSVIVIAENASVLKNAKPFVGDIYEEVIALVPAVAEPPQKILLLGWNRRATAMINEIDQCVQSGSSLSIVSEYENVEASVRDDCAGTKNVAIDIHQASTSKRRSLESLDIARYDQVIVLCYSEDLEPGAADAKTIITLLHLREIVTREKKDIRIASEMLDDRNRRLAQVASVDDIIVSERVVSLMAAQISESRTRTVVLNELLQADGAEIYIRPMTEYVREGVRTNFATLVEAARRRDETAIGYRVATLSRDHEQNYGIRLNPSKTQEINVASADRIIVVSDNYYP